MEMVWTSSGGDGIPVGLFQILTGEVVKVLHSIRQIWKTQQWPQDWKRSVFIPIPKKGNAKECSDYAQLHSSHRLAKQRSNSPSQASAVHELPGVQAGFRKGRGTRDQTANIS